MRRAALLAVALLLAAATSVQADAYPNVSGTYTYVFSGGASTVTLDGEATGQGLGTFVGNGTFSFDRDNGVHMSGDLTCVSVHKQTAMAWGVVTDKVGTDATIWGALVYDSGLAGGSGDMAISFAAPGEMPANCNIPPAWGTAPKYLAPITSGDVVID